ncbi:cellulose biosynthesis protein BcsQ [Pseudomonas sp. Hp2]|uniref:cellulose biosynthesis protein BcsQ n=1 Tax=Pseudomonas sp. Hp2 TaxID=701189 RepID=UPI001127AB40|nr:cellulose biosynthesis protein BcsQ [Pseudomonas sp. Hp2]
MSTTLSLQGVRGGVGVTAVLAGLALALHAQRQRVLVVDASPDNLLGLYMNLPVSEGRGWARADLDGGDWRDAAFAIDDGLALLPYGLLEDGEAEQVERDLTARPGRWADRLAAIEAQFDWILFDLPQRWPAHAAAIEHAGCALPLRLTTVDPGSHVLLHRRRDIDKRLLLVNRYDPATIVQRDLMQLWLRQYAGLMVPQPIHEDACVPEALAGKAPLGLHAPDSLAAADIASLAVWCLAQAARLAPGRNG